MIDKVTNSSLDSFLMNSMLKEKKVEPVSKSKETDSDAPSFRTYTKSYETKNGDRLINGICHIKLDGDDVVIYKDKINSALLYGNFMMDGITFSQELVRLPKDEVKDLINELFTE